MSPEISVAAPPVSTDFEEPSLAKPTRSRCHVPPDPLQSRTAYTWLLVAVLLFLIQALPFFSYRWLTDESWYAGPAYTISQGQGVSDPGMGPNELEHTLDSRPPGTALVMAGSFKLFGVGQDSARLGSLFAGIGIVLLTFVLLRDLFGYEAAVVGALIAATDNLIVLTSRTARPEALTTLSILLGMLALMQYAKVGKLGWAVGCGLLMALGTMFHITLLGYIVSFGLLMIALDYMSRRFPLRGALLYTLGFAAGLIPYAVWILHAGQTGKLSFQHEFIGRAEGSSLAARLAGETSRYSDLLGLGMLHTHGLGSVPVRLPIPLVFLAASYLLWRFRRTWFYAELVLLIPTVLWLVYTANKSSRYLVLLAPLFAMVIGAAAASLRGRPKAHRAMVLAAALVVVAQLGANLFLLNQARHANYKKVGDELRSVIPPGATTYGAVTFWLALRNRNYIAYERTSPEIAANEFHAQYFIVGDRMMAGETSWANDYYKQLKRDTLAVASRGKLVAEFPDPYYGDLKIYKLQP